MGNCIQTAGPNEVLFCLDEERELVVTDGGWIRESKSNVDRLNTSAMLLKPRCESVERADGKVINIGGVAVVTILGLNLTLNSAKEFCMNKNSDEIENGFQKIIEDGIRKLAEDQYLNMEVFKDLNELSTFARQILGNETFKYGFEIQSLNLYLEYPQK